jgi:hypothetical protein
VQLIKQWNIKEYAGAFVILGLGSDQHWRRPQDQR